MKYVLNKCEQFRNFKNVLLSCIYTSVTTIIVRFVDIGGIVDNHYFNFHFIRCKMGYSLVCIKVIKM